MALKINFCIEQAPPHGSHHILIYRVCCAPRMNRILQQFINNKNILDLCVCVFELANVSEKKLSWMCENLSTFASSEAPLQMRLMRKFSWETEKVQIFEWKYSNRSQEMSKEKIFSAQFKMQIKRPKIYWWCHKEWFWVRGRFSIARNADSKKSKQMIFISFSNSLKFRNFPSIGSAEGFYDPKILSIFTKYENSQQRL